MAALVRGTPPNVIVVLEAQRPRLSRKRLGGAPAVANA